MPTDSCTSSEKDAEDARLDAEITLYLEHAQAESTPPRLIALARELQRKLRERGK